MFVTLCEYVTINPDGTATLLRAGIDRWSTPQLPAQVQAVVFVETTVEELPPGEHDVQLTAVGPDGTSLFQTGGKVLAVSRDDATYGRFAIPVVFSVPSYGVVRVILKVGPVSVERLLRLMQIKA